jgi:ribosome-associated toxin RatA of RatAB toxin-antitoxin module
LVDYEKYPQFMPNMETTQIKSTDGNTSVVECKLGLPMGQVKRYRLSLTASREEAEAYIT